MEIKSEIEKLNEEYIFVREEVNNLGLFAETNFEKYLNEFFNEYKEFSKELVGFGDDFKIEIPICCKHGKADSFTIIFSPWNVDEKLLRGMLIKPKESNEFKIYYTFYPNFVNQEESFNNEEKNRNSKEYYMPITTFIFLQIYEKKDEIIIKFRRKIKETLEKSIIYEKDLLRLANKYFN